MKCHHFLFQEQTSHTSCRRSELLSHHSPACSDFGGYNMVSVTEKLHIRSPGHFYNKVCGDLVSPGPASLRVLQF